MNTAEKIATAPLGKTHIFYLGQAGFALKSKTGTLLGLDMYLSQCVERVEGNDGYKRLTPQILMPEEITFDFVLATHPHFDHFDMDAIPVLMSNRHTKLLASVNCRREIQRLMINEERVTYMKTGDEFDADDIHISCVPCDHGTGAPDAVGIVLSIDGERIYIAGDTCLRTDYAERIKEMGPFGVMIAPINGAYGNLNEEECVELAKILKPEITIPCHYGMFASHGGNPGIFREKMIQELPEHRYLLMCPGEELVLEGVTDHVKRI